MEMWGHYKAWQMGANGICQKCRAASNVETNALTAWLTPGQSADCDVVFVGKVARGDSIGTTIGEALEDVSAFGNGHIRDSSWPYWAYTRQIIQHVYESLDAGLNRVGFTNIVKCNDNSDKDNTSALTKEFCIKQNGFIWKEIAVFKPRLIVFYTNRDYDDFIESFLPNGTTLRRDLTDRGHRVPIGKKKMPWWEREFLDDAGKTLLKFLRIGHPERKLKTDFTASVAKWVAWNLRSFND